MTDEPLYTKLGFTDAEWGLLVGLPQSVLTAASAATPDSARKTRAENEAGRDVISDARVSASPLVAAVAAGLLSEVGDPELGVEVPVIEPNDPIAYVGDVLDRVDGRPGVNAVRDHAAHQVAHRRPMAVARLVDQPRCVLVVPHRLTVRATTRMSAVIDAISSSNSASLSKTPTTTCRRSRRSGS